MKKLFTLLICLLSIALQAQNWAPIKGQNKYNYSLGESDILSHTIWIDSSANNSSYLNRIIRDIPDEDDYDLGNQTQFLMGEMESLENGIFHFKDSASFVILTQASLNQSWLYDTLNNVGAKVSSLEQNNVLGQNDSTKTIKLYTINGSDSISTGDSIVLSKNYGIVQFYSTEQRNYTLKGIEGQNQIGEQSLNFFDVFNFSVGDVFQYSISHYEVEHPGINPQTTPPNEYYELSQSEVTSYQISGDTIIVGWKKVKSWFYGYRFTLTLAKISSS
tara:strand:- start:20099 stop:20923 length:825 start_codon:yes stop_codon:yes gene_type:complete